MGSETGDDPARRAWGIATKHRAQHRASPGQARRHDPEARGFCGSPQGESVDVSPILSARCLPRAIASRLSAGETPGCHLPFALESRVAEPATPIQMRDPTACFLKSNFLFISGEWLWFGYRHVLISSMLEAQAGISHQRAIRYGIVLDAEPEVIGPSFDMQRSETFMPIGSHEIIKTPGRGRDWRL